MTTTLVRSAYQMACMHNEDADSITAIASISANNKDYRLCIFGVGEDAYFEWIGEDGQPIGEQFHSVTEMTQHVFEASVSTKH